MGRIVISTNVTLDGVVQDPDGREGVNAGGWFDESIGADRAEWAQVETEEALNAEALLLGRRSDAWFAERWLARTGVLADRLTSLPKYVVSSTIEQPQWTNASVLAGDVAKELAELKEQVEGDIVVYASYRLVSTILQLGMADELRLIVFPVVAGSGRRLFEDIGDKKSMRLLGTRQIGAGLVSYTYEFVPAA